MTLAILGMELTQLVCAHTIFDLKPDSEIHLISERAEAGLIGELPGLISQPLSNYIPSEWLGDLGSQIPTTSDTAVRRSWLEKALATKLVERGENIGEIMSIVERSPSEALQQLQSLEDSS